MVVNVYMPSRDVACGKDGEGAPMLAAALLETLFFPEVAGPRVESLGWADRCLHALAHC